MVFYFVFLFPVGFHICFSICMANRRRQESASPSSLTFGVLEGKKDKEKGKGRNSLSFFFFGWDYKARNGLKEQR